MFFLLSVVFSTSNLSVFFCPLTYPAHYCCLLSVCFTHSFQFYLILTIVITLYAHIATFNMILDFRHIIHSILKTEIICTRQSDGFYFFFHKAQRSFLLKDGGFYQMPNIRLNVRVLHNVPHLVKPGEFYLMSSLMKTETKTRIVWFDHDRSTYFASFLSLVPVCRPELNQ